MLARPSWSWGVFTGWLYCSHFYIHIPTCVAVYICIHHWVSFYQWFSISLRSRVLTVAHTCAPPPVHVFPTCTTMLGTYCWMNEFWQINTVFLWYGDPERCVGSHVVNVNLHFILSTWQTSVEEFVYVLPWVLSPFTVCSHPGWEGSRNSSALAVAHLSSETDSGKIRPNSAFASVAFAILSPTWQYLGQYHNHWWKHQLNFLEWFSLLIPSHSGGVGLT